LKDKFRGHAGKFECGQTLRAGDARASILARFPP
jgi:hypothetical protein